MDSARSIKSTPPKISVVVLNYNGRVWLDRCVASLKAQTMVDQLELILADNASSDGSDQLAEALTKDWSQARFVRNGGNLGFCEGNNRPARLAVGDYLFFLNNDTWLEPDCLEKLWVGVQALNAEAGMPLILNYHDQSFQHTGVSGFDLFGWATHFRETDHPTEVFSPHGCAYLIERKLFHELGEFDAGMFMYADEMDLSCRLWLSGHRAVVVPTARLHHRGAANVNPAGGAAPIELRTSDSTRYYSNRNSLMIWMKYAQHVLWALVPLQILLLAAESIAGLALTRRWSFVKRAYIEAIRDAWRMRGHASQVRRNFRNHRRRGDFWMLRFLRWRFQRWDELQRIRRFGFPKVAKK